MPLNSSGWEGSDPELLKTNLYPVHICLKKKKKKEHSQHMFTASVFDGKWHCIWMRHETSTAINFYLHVRGADNHAESLTFLLVVTIIIPHA